MAVDAKQIRSPSLLFGRQNNFAWAHQFLLLFAACFSDSMPVLKDGEFVVKSGATAEVFTYFL
jgi:hypothetical protein